MAATHDIPNGPIVGSVSTARSRSVVRNIVALMLREMASRYGTRPGGYVWAVLEPLSMILLLSVAFSLLLRTPPLGTSFVLFYATGFVPFTLFRNIQGSVQNAIGYSRPLMIFPVVNWLDAVLARFLLNLLTTLLVGFILLAGILQLQDTRAILRFGPILDAFAMCGLIGLGLGMVNCILIGFIPVWKSIFAVIMRPLAIASGVILLYENLPGWVQDILWWNPLLHALGQMRAGFYPTYAAAYVSHEYVYGVAFVLNLFGLLMLRRHHRTLLGRF